MKGVLRNKIETFADEHPAMWRRISKTVRFFRCANTSFYRIRNGRKNESKIKVAFIITMPEIWTSAQAVYERMKNDQQFETFLVAQPKRVNMPQSNEAYEFLSKHYPEVINSYENNKWLDLKDLCCDYVFYIRPYVNEYFEAYKPTVVKKYAKICHIPYGYILNSGAIFDTCYNGTFLSECSIVFLCNRSSLKINQERFGLAAKTHMINLVYLGFPRFDLLQRMKNDTASDRKFTILWTPRFPGTENGLNMPGHFLDYYKDLLRYVSEQNDVKLIIRPHPLMFERFKMLGLLKEKDISNIQNEIAETNNVELDVNKNYMVSFEKSDLLISDASSLLIEYFYTGKPILYCDNSNLFLEEALKMDRSLYHCSEWQEMKQVIDDIRSGNDSLFDMRKETIDILFPDDSNVAHNITEYIVKDYKKNRLI